MRLSHLFEARKPAPAPLPVNYHAVLERLKHVAEKMVRSPFDFDWDYSYGQQIKQKAEAEKARHVATHDPEYDGELTPLDDRDLYTDNLPDAWRALVTRTFSAAPQQIDHDILAYQKRHGERLDREAGHEHDMHFIEDSDWLRAMEAQKRFAKAIGLHGIHRAHDILTITALLEAFADDWREAAQTDQGDEATLVEAITEGLSAAIPLLLLVAKKSA